mgnify:CR=1 FL=1
MVFQFEPVAAGLDLEMPSSGGVNDKAIAEAVQSDSLPEDALDTACLNLLRLINGQWTREAISPSVD